MCSTSPAVEAQGRSFSGEPLKELLYLQERSTLLSSHHGQGMAFRSVVCHDQEFKQRLKDEYLSLGGSPNTVRVRMAL